MRVVALVKDLIRYVALHEINLLLSLRAGKREGQPKGTPKTNVLSSFTYYMPKEVEQLLERTKSEVRVRGAAGKLLVGAFPPFWLEHCVCPQSCLARLHMPSHSYSVLHSCCQLPFLAAYT